LHQVASLFMTNRHIAVRFPYKCHGASALSGYDRAVSRERCNMRAPRARARARKKERKREHTRVTQRPFKRYRVYRRFLSLHHTRRPFECPVRRTVYQRFYHVLPLAHTHDLSIGRFVTSITGQAIEPYKRQVDYAYSTIYNRDRYPASCAHIGKR